jgi:hypothetical protein
VSRSGCNVVAIDESRDLVVARGNVAVDGRSTIARTSAEVGGVAAGVEVVIS